MLEIKNLYVNYGHIAALRDVSIRLDSNEVVALIGSNGAGKTTTLRAISGQLKPKSGENLWDGISLIGKAPHEIAKMGIVHVPEGRKIFYKLSVHENLMMGAYAQKDKKRTDENYERALELFPILKERLKQAGGTLSGGEQQMLAFGRALMADPQILMLDEPSLGLAPLVVEKIADNIEIIAKTGIPILLVEQNANIALEISDRAYIIETGKIELTGESNKLAGDRQIQKSYLGIS